MRNETHTHSVCIIVYRVSCSCMRWCWCSRCSTRCWAASSLPAPPLRRVGSLAVNSFLATSSVRASCAVRLVGQTRCVGMGGRVGTWWWWAAPIVPAHIVLLASQRSLEQSQLLLQQCNAWQLLVRVHYTHLRVVGWGQDAPRRIARIIVNAAAVINGPQ